MSRFRLPGRSGPVITLLAGTGLAAALLVASMVAANSDGAEPAERPVAGDASPTPAPSPTGPDASPGPDGAAEEAAVEPPPVTYVGWVDSGGASVAIIVTGDEAIGYVCDGATAEAWLQGSADGDQLRLTGDGGELTASYDGDRATGETTVAGRTWSFTAEQVDQPEGLYRFADTVAGGAEVDGGWIVLPDGSQVGVVTVDGTPQPAPALDPATGAAIVDGTRVTAERQG
jgi:hypothetical protein